MFGCGGGAVEAVIRARKSVVLSPVGDGSGEAASTVFSPVGTSAVKGSSTVAVDDDPESMARASSAAFANICCWALVNRLPVADTGRASCSPAPLEISADFPLCTTCSLPKAADVEDEEAR